MINLELLTDGTATARNFDKLRSLTIDTGGESIGQRFGTGTLTFTAAAASATLTITHGLGTTPQFINAFATLGTEYIVVNYVASSRNDTTFQVKAQTNSGASITADVDIFWEVKG